MGGEEDLTLTVWPVECGAAVRVSGSHLGPPLQFRLRPSAAPATQWAKFPPGDCVVMAGYRDGVCVEVRDPHTGQRAQATFRC